MQDESERTMSYDSPYQVGSRHEIRPAYEMDTHDYTRWDEVAGCECWIVRLCEDSDTDVRVEIKGIVGEWTINVCRLRPR